MQLLEYLKEKLASNQILVEDALKSRYTHIWKMDEGLKAKVVVLPESTEDVSEILKICNKLKQKVAIHGGLTNLVGGTETEGDELVISLEKMNKIEEVDPMSRTITAEAGVILQAIHEKADEHQLFFPLNFGAKGTAQVGGIISSNAGGLRVLKYGMTRQLVLGIEAVLADGTIISGLKKIVKDNSGYNLNQLFIGSEGTLGIVTKAVFRLYEKPTSRQSCMVAVRNYDSVVAFMKHMDAGLAGLMSGFELMWNNYYQMATSSPSLVKPPIPHGHPYYVLVESLGSDNDADRDKMTELLESALHQNLIEDAVLAHNESDMNWFWTIREDVRTVVSQMKVDQHFDISLPISEIGEVIDTMLDKLKNLKGVEQIITFGHVADGNIHLIIGKDTDTPELTLAVNEIIYAPLKDIGGSVSAEHGIGLHKKAYLELCRTESEIQTMQILKRTLDPLNILNPRHIFPNSPPA